MKLLLDSHLLIWLLYEPHLIPGEVVEEIQAAETVFLSVASHWELALKHAKRKLAYSPAELAEGRVALHLHELPILREHILKLPDVKLLHANPFDHLLTAQALAERAILVTADTNILSSGHERLKAA